MSLSSDVALQKLAEQRNRLMRQLAPVLRRLGPNSPQRNVVNKQRTKLRRQLRRQLKLNADAIVAHVMQQLNALTPEE